MLFSQISRGRGEERQIGLAWLDFGGRVERAVIGVRTGRLLNWVGTLVWPLRERKEHKKKFKSFNKKGTHPICTRA